MSFWAAGAVLRRYFEVMWPRSFVGLWYDLHVIPLCTTGLIILSPLLTNFTRSVKTYRLCTNSYSIFKLGYYMYLRVRLIFKGYAAGPHYRLGGGGSNFMCLPEQPQWKTYINGGQRWVGTVYGVEYELFNGRSRNNIFSETNNNGKPIVDKPAPCAVCYVADRSTTLMIPARTQCPHGWIPEYAGYLVSEAGSGGRHRSNYVCWDEAPEVAVGGRHKQNHAVIYPVEVRCGSLPCSEYIDKKELACIVCSKW